VIQQELDAASLLAALDNLELDRQTIQQEKLDLASKHRSSLLPWRGQFSPGLIELFLDHYAFNAGRVLDPFVGSGTTLFESARKGLECYGAELNPSAVELARTAEFVNLSSKARNDVVQATEEIIRRYIRPRQPTLFDYDLYNEHLSTANMAGDAETRQLFLTMLDEAHHPHVRNFLINVIMRYMDCCTIDGTEGFLRVYREHAALVRRLPYSDKPCRVLHADARLIDLPDQSIDLVITSPPYINVFNYHQNYRPAMELIGWDLLRVAKSEIGSNRKHRQNRFLTVIQYCLDIADVLTNMKRMLRTSGHAIIVVGRESSVRGVSFKNGSLVAAIAIAASSMTLVCRQERTFKNKFGELICEDILHLKPSENTMSRVKAQHVARAIGAEALKEAALKAPDKVRSDIQNALQRVATVQQSPLFAGVHGITGGNGVF
jgi:DNA modification methylase